jgi:predicted nucleic acid-binding protein
MNVVDSSGWLEYFKGENNAGFFALAIVDIDRLIVPTICIYEVSRRMMMQRGEQEALHAIGVMCLGNLVELNRQIAMDAAKLSLNLKLAMADSIILATARAHDAILWTQDEHFKDIEGVRYIDKG